MEARHTTMTTTEIPQPCPQWAKVKACSERENGHKVDAGQMGWGCDDCGVSSYWGGEPRCPCGRDDCPKDGQPPPDILRVRPPQIIESYKTGNWDGTGADGVADWDLDSMESVEIVNPPLIGAPLHHDDLRLLPVLEKAVLDAVVESLDLDESAATMHVLATLNRLIKGVPLSVDLSPVEDVLAEVLDVDGEWVPDSDPPTFQATLRIEVPLEFSLRTDP